MKKKLDQVQLDLVQATRRAAEQCKRADLAEDQLEVSINPTQT